MSAEQSAGDPGDAPAPTEPAGALRPPRTTAFDKGLMDVLPHMRAFAQFLTRDKDKAGDLVQDAVVRILRAQHLYQPGTNFKAWVFTILRNLNINSFRVKFRETIDLDDPGMAVCSAPPNQYAVLEFHELERAMSKLPPEQREVLILVGAEGFSYEEAALICGCAIGTIKSRMSRARDVIFQLLGGMPGDATFEPSRNSSRRPSLIDISERDTAASTIAPVCPFPVSAGVSAVAQPAADYVSN